MKKCSPKFNEWRELSARVQVTLEGLTTFTTTGMATQRLLTAKVDGIVHVVEPDGERTLVVVGSNNNSVHMYLTEECTFQTMTIGSANPANIADVDSMIRIAFPAGEACYVTFYRPQN